MNRLMLARPKSSHVNVMTGGLLSTDDGKPNFATFVFGAFGGLGIALMLKNQVLLGIASMGAALVGGSLIEQAQKKDG